MESREAKMLSRFCVAPGCLNRGSQKHVSFYHFPPISSKRSARGSRRGRWIEAVMGAVPSGGALSQECWEYPSNARVCSNHFISGKKSEDPLSPDYIPSVFANQTAEERRAGEAALKAYNQKLEANGTVRPFRLRRRGGRTGATVKSSLPKRLRVEAASSPVTLEDSDTQSIVSGMLDYEEVARMKEEALRERDQQKEEEEEEEDEETPHHKTITNPFMITPEDESSSTSSRAVTSQILGDLLVDDENQYRKIVSSSDTDDDDDNDDNRGVKYEDPRTLLLTGKYKELMKALQVYRKNLAASTASKKNQESSAIGERRPNYEATTAHSMDQNADGQSNRAPGRKNATSLEKMPTEQPPQTPQTVFIDGLEYTSFMTLAQERALFDCINQNIDDNFGLALEEICQLVPQFCDHWKIKLPTTWEADPFACKQYVKRLLSRFMIKSDHHQGSDTTVNGADKVNSDVVELIDDTSPRQMPEEVYVCDDGTIKSSRVSLNDVKHDHPYAQHRRTKLCMMNYSKGKCSLVEVLQTTPVLVQEDS